MRVQRFIVALCACALLGVGKPTLVLIPYQETAETGSFMPTGMLLSDLAAAGINAMSVDPMTISMRLQAPDGFAPRTTRTGS